MNTFKDQIKQDYFEWLYKMACRNKVSNNISYRKILWLLYNTDFDFYMPTDLNRFNDGVDLRYRFNIVLPNGINILDVLDQPCSVLEMMLALALRCEETIMSNPQYGDRTTQWFWNMMKNIGISYMIDEKYDEKEANSKIYRFMERQYEPNGKGGLFYMPNCEYDLRNEDIWTQLCWYLDNFE